MTNAERKALEGTDKALTKALMGLLELDGDLSHGEEVWRDICHARRLLAMVLENDPEETPKLRSTCGDDDEAA